MKAYTREALRRPVRILEHFQGKEDHGILTVSLTLATGDGWERRGFGLLCMKDEAEARAFTLEVCAIFGHHDPERLVGQECLALYSDFPWGRIEGIEAPSGRRFTIRGWRKKHYPEHAPTPTEATRDSLQSAIAFHERRLREVREELATLPTFIDWSEEP